MYSVTRCGNLSRNSFGWHHSWRSFSRTSRSLGSYGDAIKTSPENTAYIEDMYALWLTDRTKVHASWRDYFGKYGSNSETIPAPTESRIQSSSLMKTVKDHMAIQALIRSYQVIGHRVADLDPLEMDDRKDKKQFPELNISTYGFDESDLGRKFKLPSNTFIGRAATEMTLGEIVDRLENIYCSKMGIQYMFIPNKEETQWIREKFETPGALKLDVHEKRNILKLLIRASGLEAFLQTKWPSEKRFGLEGLESMIPAMQSIIDNSTSVDSFVLGMSHRGRLNVIANICQKPLDNIFVLFKYLELIDGGSGDVKYHLGLSQSIVNEATNRPVNISLCANPSHLEAVNPVVQGKTRAEQFYRGDAEGDKVMSILIHGDAAFAGQGIVFETMHLSALPDYTTHGTVHIVANNQIGFTTDPRVARSSPYCTDVARVVNAPIFHVNAEDPEAAFLVSRVAAEWRAKFHKDVVIDLVGFRKYGHNEIDEPAFTQPLMYQKIKEMKGVANDYAEKLISSGVISKEEVEEMKKEYWDFCETSFKRGDNLTNISSLDWIDSPCIGSFALKQNLMSTGVDEETVRHVFDKFSSAPADFNLHRGMKKILKQRREFADEGIMDWSMGEAVAWGSLIKDGIPVRLSGQDVERGTFSHRHSVLHDQDIDQKDYRPLCDLWLNQAPFTVCNSPLSEFGTLGFDLGFSMANPNALVMWEAQFGDFFNTAQCIIDQFISSGQAKWMRQSGIVLLLPHGFEGMGPEHSSARPERFLQLASDDADSFSSDSSSTYVVDQLKDINWQIMNLTTPANLVHAMRRQIQLPFRKPLVIMSPKSLLRSAKARSNVEDVLPGTEFKRMYVDDGPAVNNPAQVERVLFCSGKVYYELVEKRQALNLEEKIAIVRVEQICPFPYDLAREQLCLYKNASVKWVQEEPKNAGMWSYVQARMNNLLRKHMQDDRQLGYIGRVASASPATGNKKQHNNEQSQLLEAAIQLEHLPDMTILRESTRGPEPVAESERGARQAVN